ncbi:MAG: SLBB domain-containing protein, partial [Sediminibacterium sp.]
LGSTTSVSQLSNPEILAMWQKAQKGGGTDNDAIKQLLRSGMSPNEVNAFKKKLLQAQSSSKTKVSGMISDTATFLHDSSWVLSVPQLRKPSPYYGFDFFSNPSITFEPNLNINPPKTYILGPGDAITVTLTGVNETTVSDKIGRDGSFQVPHGDLINLGGLTLDEAQQKIKAKMKMAYPALTSGQTKLFITLDNARNISIHIIGEAVKPGTYTVSALSGFFNVLYLSEGPSPQGSLRKLELIRNNKLVETIDFYSFLQKGIFNKDLKLQDQDIIRIPVYTKRVALDGEIKRPFIYELLEKETLADLIDYAGGFEGNAYRESAKIVQVGGRERKIRDVNIIDFPNFIPLNADSVHIDRVLATYANRVLIGGAVQRPGAYELTEGLTLSKLIKNADGLREDAFTTLGYIKRRKADDAEREMLSFDLKTIKTGASSDPKLIKDDSVYIPSRDSIRDVPTITVGGNVRAPGIFEFRNGMSIEDAILMAGGFTNDAANHKVEISRLEKNKADTLVNQLINTFKLEVDSTLSNPGSKTLLQPLDFIFVPRLLNYRTLGNVQIRGEVLYAGDYTLERRDETIQELIGRAGGVSPYASITNTQVYRSGIRVATTIVSDKAISERFPLLPGDSIYIPRYEPFVEVKGAVFNPQMLRYESSNFLSYISEVGGVTDKGNLKKSYIQYSNGINRKIGHFLFFRNYPKVLPGSKIIVPEKTDVAKKALSVFEISALASVLTALVSMFAILKK